MATGALAAVGRRRRVGVRVGGRLAELVVKMTLGTSGVGSLAAVSSSAPPSRLTSAGSGKWYERQPR